jgi:plasmid maintenance system antidote protein VapI
MRDLHLQEKERTMSELVESRYRGWMRHSLKRPGYDQSGLAQEWNADRTAVSKALNGKRRLLVGEVVVAARYLEESPPGVIIDASVDITKIDLSVTTWLLRCVERKGDISGLADAWEVDRSTVSKAISIGRALTISELETAARYFGSNPPGFEFDAVPVGGPRLSWPLETGVYREEAAFRERSYVIEADVEFPTATLCVYPVSGKGMDMLEPRPILKGDLVVAIPVDQLDSTDDVVDGSLVVVRCEMKKGIAEWSLRRMDRTSGGIRLSSRSATKFAPLKAKGFDDPKISVVALVRRVIINV